MELIRVKDAETLAACLRVREVVFTIERGVPREIEVDEDDCLHGACEHYLVKEENRPVGALRVRSLADGEGKLQRVCVLREFRSHGIGAAVMHRIEAIYRARGFRALIVDSKDSAERFYEKCGFSPVSDVFIEAGVPHVKMRKELTGE